MIEPAIPVDESERLRSLMCLRILDTEAEERFDRVTRMAKRLFKTDICLISLIDSERQWFKSAQGLDAKETPRNISFCGHAVLQDDIFVVNDTSKDERFADNPLVTSNPHIRFYAGCPLIGPYGFKVGTLCIIHSSPRKMSAEDRDALKDLASMVEDEFKATAKATVDELTKVANRRGFYSVGSHMLALCRRTNTSAEVLFFDLNGLKKINDTYGHSKGDELIVDFAELLMKCFRSADVIARWGGDEFVVLMTASHGKHDVALERMEKYVRDTNCNIGRQLSWSTGWAQFEPERHSSLDQLVEQADKLMYKDKQLQSLAATV